MIRAWPDAVPTFTQLRCNVNVAVYGRYWFGHSYMRTGYNYHTQRLKRVHCELQYGANEL